MAIYKKLLELQRRVTALGRYIYIFYKRIELNFLKKLIIDF